MFSLSLSVNKTNSGPRYHLKFNSFSLLQDLNGNGYYTNEVHPRHIFGCRLLQLPIRQHRRFFFLGETPNLTRYVNFNGVRQFSR